MEGIRGTTHPLQTPIILECVFSNLGLPDLKNCRLVSRAWRRSGAVATRELVMVKFETVDSKIWKFLELVQNENSIFSESAFVNIYELYDLDLNVAVIEFFRICGKSVKILCLVSIEFYNEDAENFRKVIFQLCPNMTELYLQQINLYIETTGEPTVWVPPRFPQNKNLKKLTFIEDMELGEMSFLEILSHYPELKKIVIETMERSSERIFQALATARRHNPQCWNIKNISFNFENLPEPQKNLLPLLEGNLSLETMTVMGIEESKHAKVIAEVLGAHATSLKRLILRGSMAADTIDASNNQILEKLEYLYLLIANLSSTSFLRKCPNLQKLKLHSVLPQAEFSQEPMNEGVISSCTQLDLYSEGFRKPELQRLLRRLPNLEELTIRLCDNEMFSVICELLPNLTFLHITGSNKVDDTGISGLDEEDVERINEEEAYGWIWWRPIYPARPNLSSLKNLKWFRFDKNPSARKELGACAALCGIQELPQLKHLKLIEFRSPKWDRLLSKFQWKNP